MMQKTKYEKVELQIHKMRPEDIERVVEIENSSFSCPWSKKSFMYALESDYSYMITAKSSEKIFGYAGMYSVRGEGYIYNIAVDKYHRKRGIGTLLLSDLIRYSKESKLSFLSLEVRESNVSAIDLYLKLGFINQGVRKKFYDKPTENAVIMTIFLS